MKSYEVIRVNENNTATILMDINGLKLQQDVPTVDEKGKNLSVDDFKLSAEKVLQKFDEDLKAAMKREKLVEKSPVNDLVNNPITVE